MYTHVYAYIQCPQQMYTKSVHLSGWPICDHITSAAGDNLYAEWRKMKQLMVWLPCAPCMLHLQRILALVNTAKACEGLDGVSAECPKGPSPFPALGVINPSNHSLPASWAPSHLLFWPMSQLAAAFWGRLYDQPRPVPSRRLRRREQARYWLNARRTTQLNSYTLVHATNKILPSTFSIHARVWRKTRHIFARYLRLFPDLRVPEAFRICRRLHRGWPWRTSNPGEFYLQP